MSHQIKIARAKALSTIGDCHNSFDAMLAYIPAGVLKTLPAKRLAQMVDGLWLACGATRAIAARDAIEDGFVWDERAQRAINLAH